MIHTSLQAGGIARLRILLSVSGSLIGRPDQEAIYRLPSVRRSLRAVYDRFALMAQSHNLHPVIAFVPTNDRDQTSGLLGIAAASETQRANVKFVNLGREFEWSKFPRGCHPSPNGYGNIATEVARAVGPFLAVSSAWR